MEIDRGGESMTADTLAALAERHRGAELFLVIGNDVAAQLDTWRRADEVKARASLVVVSRAGSKKPEVDGSWRPTWVAIPALEISSTDLREPGTGSVELLADVAALTGKQPSGIEQSRIAPRVLLEHLAVFLDGPFGVVLRLRRLRRRHEQAARRRQDDPSALH